MFFYLIVANVLSHPHLSFRFFILQLVTFIHRLQKRSQLFYSFWVNLFFWITSSILSFMDFLTQSSRKSSANCVKDKSTNSTPNRKFNINSPFQHAKKVILLISWNHLKKYQIFYFFLMYNVICNVASKRCRKRFLALYS